VPVSAADRLAETALVLPPPAALEVSQDRFTEKQFLNESDIETAPWRLVDDEETLIAALGALGERGILKTRRLGYDGKGQVRLTSLDESEAHKAILAINRAPAILEGFIDFEREVSVIAARDRNGNIAIFDIAENVHKDGILATSTVPAVISESTAEAARKAATKLLNALDYVGVLGLEFFVLKTAYCWQMSLPRVSITPATGRKRPVPFRSLNSTFAPLPDCPWATPTAIPIA
jgi:5-(carboxyamino)imidazole ribonucleotide synthase